MSEVQGCNYFSWSNATLQLGDKIENPIAYLATKVASYVLTAFVFVAEVLFRIPYLMLFAQENKSSEETAPVIVLKKPSRCSKICKAAVATGIVAGIGALAYFYRNSLQDAAQFFFKRNEPAAVSISDGTPIFTPVGVERKSVWSEICDIKNVTTVSTGKISKVTCTSKGIFSKALSLVVSGFGLLKSSDIARYSLYTGVGLVGAGVVTVGSVMAWREFQHRKAAKAV